MGMLDEKRYLTGTNGVLVAGDVFLLHDAAIAGKVRKPNSTDMIDEARLVISKPGAEQITVFTTGVAIVGQVGRIDDQDRMKMRGGTGMLLRLGQLPAQPNQSPAYILEDPQASEDIVPPQTSPAQTPGAPAQS